MQNRLTRRLFTGRLPPNISTRHLDDLKTGFRIAPPVDPAVTRHRGRGHRRDRDPAEITDRHGQLTTQASGKELPALDHYHRLHLDDDHEAAQIGGLSVEAAHIEGLAQFIRKSEPHGLDLPQAVEGFLQIFNGMADW